MNLMSWIIFVNLCRFVLTVTVWREEKIHVVALRKPRVQGLFGSWPWAVLPLPPKFDTVGITSEFAFRSASLAVRLLRENLHPRLP